MRSVTVSSVCGETAAHDLDSQLVSGKQLLEILFPPESRPTLRWLRDQQKERTIPHMKVGRLVFFSPRNVRAALRDRHSIPVNRWKGGTE